jgi:hypothetical protein
MRSFILLVDKHKPIPRSKIVTYIVFTEELIEFVIDKREKHIPNYVTPPADRNNVV